jgi:hypothetical protein
MTGRKQTATTELLPRAALGPHDAPGDDELSRAAEEVLSQLDAGEADD